MKLEKTALAGLGLNSKCLDQVIEYTNEYAPEFDMQTKKRLAHFLAQVCHESNGFNLSEESLFYSTPERLKAVWPKRFPTIEFARGYIKNPQKLANYVYANRNGNGDAASGDGYKFRGRGPIQITGRTNYTAMSKKMFGDDTLVKNLELLLDLKHGLKAAFIYWKDRNCNDCADRDSLTEVTKKINGGTVGLADRKSWYNKWNLRLTA